MVTIFFTLKMHTNDIFHKYDILHTYAALAICFDTVSKT